MDQELLVDNRIEDGERLLSQLASDGFAVSVALWIKSTEGSVWSLYIASPLVTDEKPGDAYGLAYVSLSRVQDCSISLSEIKLINSQNPIAKQAIPLRDRHKGRQAVHLRVQRFATVTADEVLIYPRPGGQGAGGAHRDLIGIESPPSDHEPDNMTLGPVLPLGWDGDAWTRDAPASSYWLRAWNKKTGQYAIAQGGRYEDARRSLLDRIQQGGSGKVDVRVVESKPELFLTPSHDDIRRIVKEKIEFAYTSAIQRGLVDPCVLTLDLRDDNACWVADLMSKEEEIARARQEASQRNTIPTVTFALSRKQTEKIVGKLDPGVARSLESTPTPSGFYLSVVIAESRLSGRGLPVPSSLDVAPTASTQTN